MRWCRWRIILLGLVFACQGCVTQAGLYKAGSGPFEVAVVESMLLPMAGEERQMRLRVSYPRGDGPFPVIVYSHGAFCDPEMYARVTDHWSSHGYVVILPNHLDSPHSGGRLAASDRGRLVGTRISDMSWVLDSLDAIEAKIPNLAGKTDRERLAAAGHSFGSMIASVVGGVRLKNPQTGEALDFSEPRFDVLVVMSGVGQMPEMTNDAWDYLTLPVYASGGTLDTGNTGDGNIRPWQWRMGAYELSPPGDKYSLVLEQGDHYLGGLICRSDRGGEADPEGVAIINATSTAFLDAYLKQHNPAMEFLNGADLDSLTNGRARFQSK